MHIKEYYIGGHLKIILRALNFYEVIVNEGEAQVNYRFEEIESK